MRHRGVWSRPTAVLMSATLAGAGAVVGVTAMTAAPASAAADGPAWSCGSSAYLFQNDDSTDGELIYSVDLVTGASQQTLTLPDQVNSVAYNTTDNYMYAWDFATKSPVEIASDGTLTTLPVPDGVDSTEGFNTGEFDDSGHYWIGTSGTDGKWDEIDYAEGSSTYGEVIASGVSSDSIDQGADDAYADGGLYSVNPEGHLIKFDTTTHEETDLGVPDGMPTSTYGFGAAYSDSNGYLYYSNDDDGEIYRVDPTTMVADDLSSGPATTGNDGARCASAIPTLAVEKKVGSRAASADEFTVGLADSDAKSLASVTTTGTETSATSEQWPVTKGDTYTISDVMATGSESEIGDYTGSVSCTDTDTGAAVATTGSTGAWKMAVPGTDNYLCVVTNTATPKSFTVRKTASATTTTEGSKVDYTVTVKNTGKVDYTSAEPATFADDLSKDLDDATYDNDASKGATVDGSTLTWSGALAVGATEKVTYSVTVKDPDTGDHTLTNTVTPGKTGTCAASGACVTHTIVKEPTATATAAAAGPTVSTGGTAVGSSPTWPWIGGGGAALAVMAALTVAGVRRRARA